MPKSLNSKQKYIICIILLVLITSAIFTFTVFERNKYFGYLSPGNQQNQSCTGYTVICVRNWYREGAINLKYAMIFNPSSIEFPDLGSRNIYISYPPGALIPLYLISIITNMEPGVDLAMGYNLANHFLIALFLSITCFIFLRKIKLNFLYSFILSIIPVLIELLTPGPLYFHQNVFWTDEAIILPFILLIFLEVLRDKNYNKKTKITIEVLQGLLLFYGVLTDWLFVFVAITLYIKRIANKELGNNKKIIFKKTAYFFIPSILAALFYIIQVIYYRMWPKVIERFLLRAAINEEGRQEVINFSSRFWFSWVIDQYGLTGLILLWISMIILIVFIILIIYRCLKNKKNNNIIVKYTSLSSLLIIPCLIQVYLFKNHSFTHNFSALKLSLALSILPLAIFPGIIIALINNSNIVFYKKNKNTIKIIIIILAIALLSFSVFYVINNYKILNFPPKKEYKKYGEFISNNSSYKDIFFSSSYEVPAVPPLKMAYSLKRVYKIVSMEDICYKIKKINKDPNIAVFIPNLEEGSLDTNLKILVPLSYSYETKNNMAIYKIKYDDFIEFTHEYPLRLKYVSDLFKSSDFNKLIEFSEELSNEEYLDIIYRVVLQRPPDIQGYNHYLDLLDKGMNKAELFEEFLQSPEYEKLNSEDNNQ